MVLSLTFMRILLSLSNGHGPRTISEYGTDKTPSLRLPSLFSLLPSFRFDGGT